MSIFFSLVLLEKGEEVGVSGIYNSKNSNSVISSTGWSKIDIVSSVMVDISIGKKRVVVDLSLDNWGGVWGNEDDLEISLSEGFKSGAVT